MIYISHLGISCMQIHANLCSEVIYLSLRVYVNISHSSLGLKAAQRDQKTTVLQHFTSVQTSLNGLEVIPCPLRELCNIRMSLTRGVGLTERTEDK